MQAVLQTLTICKVESGLGKILEQVQVLTSDNLEK
jgi:hypothetical protein